MDDNEHSNKTPAEAHREGLEEVQREPHHETTQHDKSAHPQVPVESPAEKHRANPFPRR